MATPKAPVIAGVFEHPTRKAADKSLAQLHAEVAVGALNDAGLTLADVDAYFVAGDNTNLYPLSLMEYLGLNPAYVGSTDVGGSVYLTHVRQAIDAINAGRCKVALITLAGRPRTGGAAADPVPDWSLPDVPFEQFYGRNVINSAALCATRHMYEFGTTSEQLAWIKVAASHHAQHNPNAMLKTVVTVDDVLASPMITDPLHRLDCCVISDGGGALVVVAPEIARDLSRPLIHVRGSGDAIKHQSGGDIDLTYTASRASGAAAFAEAAVTPTDIKYASLYDSFTITVLEQIEDLGFCEKGQGGAFVADGNLIAGVGKLPVNTDGGGLCNNHPANRGGMTKIIEAVRQLRGEAHPAVQVKNCDLALANATSGWLGHRHGAATLILEQSLEPMAELKDHPAINPETRPFWEAAAEGRLILKHCLSCGRYHHYPRSVCPFCHSTDTEWRDASGKGTVYSYSVGRRADPPLIVAYVTLKEGVTMFTNVVGVRPEDVRIAMAVEVAFESGSDGPVRPVFRPS